MSASKTLTAAVAAATICGAIGFAYAQSSDSATGAQGAPATEQMQSPAAAPTDSSTMPAQQAPAQDSTAAPSSTDNSMQQSAPSTDTSTDSATEPAPKADRN